MMFHKHNLIGRKNKKHPKPKATSKRRISKAVVETLETRQLMSSAAIIDGTLTITGDTHRDNDLSVRLTNDGETLQVQTNGKTRTFARSEVDGIKIVGSEKADLVNVDLRLTMPMDVQTFGGNDVVIATDQSLAHDGDIRYDASLKKNVVVNASDGPRITSFTLIDADSDQVIAEYENLGDGMTVNLASLPTRNLNIRANVADDRGGSVVFEFDGGTQLENIAHYTMAGNDGNDYYAWNPETGEFKLSATAYSHDNASGAIGATKTITLNFTDGGARAHDVQPNRNAGPDDTGEVGAPVPVITAIAKRVQAGHSIHVNALATNFKSGDALSAKYEWNFGDNDSKWNNLVGWNGSHVYDNAGTYTITLRVTNSAGKVATTTTTVTIAESTRRVIYVSNDGSDSNSGVSPNRALRSFDKAISMASSDTEILFNRGDRFTTERGGRVSGRNVVIGAYGAGARPLVRYTGPAGYHKIISVTGTAWDVSISGLAFDMKFTDMEKKNRPDAIGANGVNLTVRDNEFVNIGYAINANNDPRGMLVVDNIAPRAEAIRSYFVWADGSDISIVGNKVANSTREHNIRVSGANRVLIAHNDMTNSTGKVSGDKTPKGTLTIQKGSFVYVSRNKLTDGPVSVGPLGDGDGLRSPNDRFSWAVIEDNEFDTRMQVDHGASHVMIRGNVFAETNRSPVEIEGWNSVYRRGTSDVRVVDNLALSSGRVFVKLVGGTVTGLKQSDNGFAASVADDTPWAEEGFSSPTQWQAISTIYSATLKAA